MTSAIYFTIQRSLRIVANMGIGHIEDRFSVRTRCVLVMVFVIAMACVEAASVL